MRRWRLLANPAVDLVVNLTIHHAHPAVMHAVPGSWQTCPQRETAGDDLPRGEVGWSSWRQSASCRLSCSPITYMGEAQRTAWKAIRQGQLGQVRVVYCEVNWGRIESWHPNPGPFYEVGALFDVGVYPLTLVTTFLAPARRVVAYGKVLHPDRTTQEGVPFHIETPDWVVAAVKLAQRHGRAVDATNFHVRGTASKRGWNFTEIWVRSIWAVFRILTAGGVSAVWRELRPALSAGPVQRR
jgi:predicted dehydrogenase